MTAQAEIDARNAAFWNEPCGTTHAAKAGLTGGSIEEFRKFDRWFFDLYPYLDHHIPFDRLAGKRVLEVGLGFASVTQRLAESGALVSGLDIAPGPVALAKRRFVLSRHEGDIREGSILAAPFGDESFDHIVSIGCIHHTGDAAQALREIRRMLKPGGGASVMVYNALSLRRWVRWPLRTWAHYSRDPAGAVPKPTASAAERGAYDPDVAGIAAPETAFFTEAELRHLCRAFSQVEIYQENAYLPLLGRVIPRRWLLSTIGPVAGLDLYMHLVK